MPLTMSSGKPSVTDVPEGIHRAVCVGIYDLGTVASRNPQFKDSERVMFVFELTDEENAEGFPKTVRCSFNQSLHEKSSLRPFLRKWRGTDFTDEELGKVDGVAPYTVKERLGKPGMVQVAHSRGKGEKAANLYANVEIVQPLYRGVEEPKPSRQPSYFDLADGSTRIPDGIPEWLADEIMKSPEYRALKEGGGKPAGAAAKPQPKKVAPREIIDRCNAIGLAWPFNDDELDAAFDPDVLTVEDYDVLKKHSIPY